jgi:hypothetical protein
MEAQMDQTTFTLAVLIVINGRPKTVQSLRMQLDTIADARRAAEVERNAFVTDNPHIDENYILAGISMKERT